MTRYPLPYAYAKANTLLLEELPDELVLWAPPEAPLAALSEVHRLYAVGRMESQDAALLMERIQSAYAGSESSAATVVGEVESAVDLSRLMQDLPAVEDLLEAANDAPIIRMLNALLTQAAKDGASDIHIEPYERSSSVRFRVDGSLREVVQPNKALHAALISRLKIMAELDIAEKRLPQDGRISLRIGGRAIDVRVSTLPSAHGERAVLRLLDKSESKFSLEGLGMDGEVLASFKKLVAQPHGIVLVTGPTGSGKTTTLYAALQTIDTQTTNVLTVEDPIEYELAGIGQTQVNAKIDLTFAKALRAILRQDPDAIMIGEIRDFETAQIAIQASLTGHLVLATLHTNDAPSAVTRLTDMGVEPFLLSSSVLGVLAQRLVRKLCPSCRKLNGDGHYHPVGCAECGFTGYKGRTGVYELMVADEAVRAHIHQRSAESELTAAARSRGLRSMREDGERLVASGMTSLEEVLRVTRTDRMPAFKFEALNAAGRTQTGLIESDNPRTARAQLREMKLTPLSVEQVQQQEQGGGGFSLQPRAFGGGALSVWTRQLAGLVGSGLPLERALTALAEDCEQPRQRELLAQLKAEVNGGSTFARALASAPREFDEVYRGVVAAGEASGALGMVLERLADDLEERQALRAKLIGAMAYPAVVTLVAIVIVIFLVTYVVPQVAQAFTSTRKELPGLTVAMLAISAFVRTWGWAVLAALVAGGASFAWLLRGAAFRLRFDAFWLTLPLFGRLARGYNAARFASTLGMLAGAGVPILKALQAAAETLSNHAMRADAMDALVQVREGAPLGSALAGKKRFPGLLSMFSRLGEQTGRLPEMLSRAGAQLSSEVQRRAMALATMLEPLLIVGMGVIVLVIVMAVLQPIIQLQSFVR